MIRLFCDPYEVARRVPDMGDEGKHTVVPNHIRDAKVVVCKDAAAPFGLRIAMRSQYPPLPHMRP